MAIKCLLWAEAGDVAMALAAVDAMAVPDVTDMLGADMTVAADKGSVAMTVADVVIASQAQPPSGPTNALTKILLPVT